jgi:phosphoribosylformylglycinamidine synthase subunit PurS
MAVVVVDVALKREILDPQGRALMGALDRLGLTGVTEVRQGKQFVLTIDGEVNEAQLALVNEIALTLLSNPVIEDFTVQVRP